MWHWLPNALCNRSSLCISARKAFFLQLLGLVFVGHVFVLSFYGVGCWLFAKKHHFDISLVQSGATYVLLPLQKKADVLSKSKKINSNFNKKSEVVDLATYEKQKKGKKGSVAIAVEPQKKSSQSNKKMIAIRSKSAKKERSGVVMVDKAKNTKKSKNKKTLVKVKEVAEKSILSEEPKLEGIDKKAESVLQLEPILPAGKEPETTQLGSEVAFNENDVIFVGYQELDQTMIGAKIQHTIQQEWSPPVGMNDGISCQVQVKIDDQGKAVQTQIVTSSGVFVYDAAAKKTLLTIEYPQEVWNKTITISLGAS